MNELQLQTGAYRTTFIGTEIVRESTPDEWRCYGEILRRVDEAKQWAIGDWLADGKRHYGDGLYKEAEKIVGIDENQLRHYKSLSERFELCLRKHNLLWSHHKVVSSMKLIEEDKNGKMSWGKGHDMDKAQEFLRIAEKKELSVRDLNKLVKKYVVDKENEFRLANEPKKYHVIYADPPWPVGSIELINENGTNDKWESPITDKYPTMTIEEIKRLPIKNLSSDECSLFLWTTHTFLPDAFEIMKVWGFKFFCEIVWDKGGGWTQNGFHKRTEQLLYGYKGKINIDQYGEAIPTLIKADRGKHSKKPDSIRNMIANKTIGNRIELFARGEFDGWDVWGNEV